MSVEVLAVSSGDGANSMQDGILRGGSWMAENVGRDRQGDAPVVACGREPEIGARAHRKQLAEIWRKERGGEAP
jgi:hypothetical protein